MQPTFNERSEDYGWVREAVRRLDTIRETFDFDWVLELGEPTSSVAIEAAERSLGITLPPSLRRFYLAHDGARIAYYEIPTLVELCEQTELSRSDDLATYEVPVDDLLFVVDLGDANRYALDSSRPDERGEYLLIDAFHEVGPGEWRKSVLAASFGEWIRRIFDDFLVRGHDPLFNQPFEETTFSTRYLYEAALEAYGKGNRERARRLVLRSIEWDGLWQESYFERSVELLRRIGDEHTGDRFLLNILDYAIAARRLGKPYPTCQSGGGQNAPESFQKRFGIVVPVALRGIMRAYSSVTMFQRARFPEPYAWRSAELELFGGAHHGIRPANDIAGAPDGSIVVGMIGNWHNLSFGGGNAYDTILVDRAGKLFRAPFRAPTTGPNVSGGFVTVMPRQESEPAYLAEGIVEFVERACANDLAGHPPYTLD